MVSLRAVNLLTLLGELSGRDFVENSKASPSGLLGSAMLPLLGIASVVVGFLVWLHWRDWQRQRAYKAWENQRRKNGQH